MNSIRCLLVILSALPALLVQAGGNPATAGTPPCATDTQEGMVQTAAIPGKPDKSREPAPPPALCAADWVMAWQAAKAACPQASRIKIFYQGRSDSSLEAVKVFECVDMEAHGELLVITIKQPKQKEESVSIVRAIDMVRIEVIKSAPSIL